MDDSSSITSSYGLKLQSSSSYITVPNDNNSTVYFYDNDRDSVSKWDVQRENIVQDVQDNMFAVYNLTYLDERSCLIAACHRRVVLLDDRDQTGSHLVSFNVKGCDRFTMSQNGKYIIDRKGNFSKLDPRYGFIDIGKKTFSSAASSLSSFAVLDNGRDFVYSINRRIHCIDLEINPMSVVSRLTMGNNIGRFTLCDDERKLVFADLAKDTVMSCELSLDNNLLEHIYYTDFMEYTLDECVLTNDMSSCFSKMQNTLSGTSMLVYSHGLSNIL